MVDKVSSFWFSSSNKHQKEVQLNSEMQAQSALYVHRIKTLFKNCLDNFGKLEQACDEKHPEHIVLQRVEELTVCINCFISVMSAIKAETKGNEHYKTVVNETFSKDIRENFNKYHKTLVEIYASAARVLEQICKNRDLPPFMPTQFIPSNDKRFQDTINAYFQERDVEEEDRERIKQTKKIKEANNYEHCFEKDAYSRKRYKDGR